jgi:hypothetical protein
MIKYTRRMKHAYFPVILLYRREGLSITPAGRT